MADKPVLWLPRKVSDATVARAQDSYEVILNEADTPGTAEDIIAMSARVDAMMPCHSEHFSAAGPPAEDRRQPLGRRGSL